jgi:hypothetical protein
MRTAAALALWFVVGSCSLIGAAPAVTPVAGATSTPIQAASKPRITPPPVSPPTPPGTNLPAFKCADISGGTVGSANVTAVRVAEQAGYDRFVLEFDATVPSYTVKRQAKAVFKASASGQTIPLSGTAGALVAVHSSTESGTYTGPTDFLHPEFVVLNEAKLTGDFEGYVSWGLGLSKPACIRAFTLTDPPRLVVDIATTS